MVATDMMFPGNQTTMPDVNFSAAVRILESDSITSMDNPRWIATLCCADTAFRQARRFTPSDSSLVVMKG